MGDPYIIGQSPIVPSQFIYKSVPGSQKGSSPNHLHNKFLVVLSSPKVQTHDPHSSWKEQKIKYYYTRCHLIASISMAFTSIESPLNYIITKFD